jgi:tRNA(fMet)-specific endonuclease VapC
MILCDTNVLIEFYKGNPPIVQELRKIGVAQLAISVIAQAELYYGALNKAQGYFILNKSLSWSRPKPARRCA